MIRLDRPHVRVHQSYLRAHDEFAGEQRDGDGDWVEPADDGGYAGVTWTRDELGTDGGFARFVQWRLDRALDESPRPTGHVPATFFWVVDDAASAKVIEANGGVLEDVRGDKKRYWVPAGA